MRTSIRIDGQREAVTLLSDVGLRARRPEPALRSDDTLDALQAGERCRFSHRRGWPPTRNTKPARAWAARKRREGLDPRLMRATGKLESILTNAQSDQIRHDAFNMELRWGLKWRSVAWYAAVQAAKYKRRSGVVDKRANAEISRIVSDYIAGTWSP